MVVSEMVEIPINDNPSENNGSEVKRSSKTPKIFAHRFRYFILILGCLCLTSICSNMISLNFTFICMVHKETIDPTIIATFDNVTLLHYPQKPKYFYNQHEKSMLIWAVAISSLVATFPFTVLYSKFGAKYVLLSAGLLSAFATLLIPISVEHGLRWFLILRVFQGISYAAVFAAIGVLCSRWASLKQNGIFISVLTCFSSLATSVTNPIAGALCESRFSWPAVYYCFGTVSLVLFTLWFLLYSDHPAKHQKVTSTELEKIHRNKTEAHINMDSYVPYRQIITNPVILCVWLNALADIGSAVFLSTYMPTYINNVLHYSVAKTGILGALPAMFHIPTKVFAGWLSDKLKNYNERNKMIAFNSVALLIPGIIFAIVGFVPDSHPNIAVLLFVLINVFFGANCGGFYKCGTLVSRQYSGFVISNIQFIKCVTLFLAPALVSLFVTNDSDKSQWRTIFIFFSVLIILSNALFYYMATDEPANFTLLSRHSNITESEISKKHFTTVPAFPEKAKEAAVEPRKCFLII